MPDAIPIFKLNVELYPNPSNVYDSLAEAYAANGDKVLAIKITRSLSNSTPQTKTLWIN